MFFFVIIIGIKYILLKSIRFNALQNMFVCIFLHLKLLSGLISGIIFFLCKLKNKSTKRPRGQSLSLCVISEASSRAIPENWATVAPSGNLCKAQHTENAEELEHKLVPLVICLCIIWFPHRPPVQSKLAAFNSQRSQNVQCHGRIYFRNAPIYFGWSLHCCNLGGEMVYFFCPCLKLQLF